MSWWGRSSSSSNNNSSNSVVGRSDGVSSSAKNKANGRGSDDANRGSSNSGSSSSSNKGRRGILRRGPSSSGTTAANLEQGKRSALSHSHNQSNNDAFASNGVEDDAVKGLLGTSIIPIKERISKDALRGRLRARLKGIGKGTTGFGLNDICCVIWSVPGTTGMMRGRKDVAEVHGVFGIDCRTHAHVAAYIRQHVAIRQEEVPEGSVAEKAIFCIHDIVEDQDVRIELVFPGSLRSYCVTQDDQISLLTDSMWHATWLSSVLRAMYQSTDALTRPPTAVTLDTFSSPDIIPSLTESLMKVYFRFVEALHRHTRGRDTAENNALINLLVSTYGASNSLLPLHLVVQRLLPHDISLAGVNGRLLNEAHSALPRATVLRTLQRCVQRMKHSTPSLVFAALSKHCLASHRVHEAIVYAKRAVVAPQSGPRAWLALARAYFQAHCPRLMLSALNNMALSATAVPHPLLPKHNTLSNRNAELQQLPFQGDKLLSNLRALYLRGVPKRIYELLIEAVNEFGWTNMLLYRQQAFVGADANANVDGGTAYQTATSSSTPALQRPARSDVMESVESRPSGVSASIERGAVSSPHPDHAHGQVLSRSSSRDEVVQPRENGAKASPAASKGHALASGYVDESTRELYGEEVRGEAGTVFIEELVPVLVPSREAATGVGSTRCASSVETPPTQADAVLNVHADNADDATANAGDDSERIAVVATESPLLKEDVERVRIFPRMCREWLDNLFCILYEDLHCLMMNSGGAPGLEKEVESLFSSRSRTDWMYLGLLSVRLKRPDFAISCFHACIDLCSEKSTLRLRALLALLELQSEVAPLDVVISLLAQLEDLLLLVDADTRVPAVHRKAFELTTVCVVRFGYSTVVEELQSAVSQQEEKRRRCAPLDDLGSQAQTAQSPLKKLVAPKPLLFMLVAKIVAWQEHAQWA